MTTILLKLLLPIALNGLALYGLIYFVPSISYSGGIQFFALSGAIVGLLNLTLKPLLKLLSLPLMVLTGGLFTIIINAIILYLLTYIIEVIQFQDVTLAFPDWETYVIGAIVFGLLNWILGLLKI